MNSSFLYHEWSLYNHRYTKEEYPDTRIAYGLCHSLRMKFARNTIKDAARLKMARWYDRVEKSKLKSFNVIAATFYEHYDDILNFYNNRYSNTSA